MTPTTYYTELSGPAINDPDRYIITDKIVLEKHKGYCVSEAEMNRLITRVYAEAVLNQNGILQILKLILHETHNS